MRLSNLHKTYISIALINAGDGAVGTILPSLLKESGFGVSSIGFIVSVFAVLSLVSRIPAGLAYKPKNASTVMRLCLGVFALSLPFYAVVSDATSLTLLRAVGGLAFGAATTLNMAVLMDALSSASSRARAMAFYSAFMSAGFAIGNSTSGWLADTLGYDWAFRLAAVLPLVAAVFSVNVSDDKIAENGSSAGNELVDGVWSRLRDALSGPVLIIALLAFSLNALHYLMNTFFPLFALGIGLSLTSVGLLRALHSI
ncbi:MAG: MFS transporter [Chloroflexi bacterium]|nr:MFS transporter [Chloroflexota bacterium]